MTDRRVTRLRWISLTLTLILVFFVVAATIYVPRVGQRQANQTQLVVACTSAKASIEELTALNEIADRLGIPHDFTVPRLPPECAP